MVTYAELLGVETARTANAAIQAASGGTVGAQVSDEAIKENFKALFTHDLQLSPSRPVWIRRAGPEKTGEASVTVTAIVMEGGQHKLLLPGYALLGDDGESLLNVSLTPGGAAVATFKSSDRIWPKRATGSSAGSVVLAPISPNVSSVGTLQAAKYFADVAAPGQPGNEVKLLMSRGVVSTKIVSVDGMYITIQRMTGPGDGGAPVLDAQGHLVGMAYQGDEKCSMLLRLDWLFSERNIELLK